MWCLVSLGTPICAFAGFTGKGDRSGRYWFRFEVWDDSDDSIRVFGVSRLTFFRAIPCTRFLCTIFWYLYAPVCTVSGRFWFGINWIGIGRDGIYSVVDFGAVFGRSC